MADEFAEMFGGASDADWAALGAADVLGMFQDEVGDRKAYRKARDPDAEDDSPAAQDGPDATDEALMAQEGHHPPSLKNLITRRGVDHTICLGWCEGVARGADEAADTPEVRTCC